VEVQRQLARVKPFVVWTAGTLLVFALFLKWHLGDLALAPYYLSGKQVAILPRCVDLGDVAPGKFIDIDFRFVNLSLGEVKISGAASSCRGCLSTSDVPKTLSRSESGLVAVQVVSPKSAGRFSRSIVFYIEISGHLTRQVVLLVGNCQAV